MKYIIIHSETSNEFTWYKFFNIRFVLIQWHILFYYENGKRTIFSISPLKNQTNMINVSLLQEPVYQ